MALAPPPDTAPSVLSRIYTGPNTVRLNWTNNAQNATGTKIERATNSAFTQNLFTFKTTSLSTYSDTTAFPILTYYYRVMASNTVGSTTPGYPTLTLLSGPSNAV
jgi:hypothetical protein